MVKKTGWRPDKPDLRDFYYTVPVHVKDAKPGVVDLLPWCPKVFDQGDLGSCTANAIASAIQYEAIRKNEPDKDVVHSRLFIYYNERKMEDSIESDAGAEIRDGIKSVADVGACNESLWWYNVSKFKVEPSSVAYANAKKYKALKYMRVDQTLEQMKGCLAEGYPIILGITVYDSFMSDQVAMSGYVPIPRANESAQGGHAILVVGYDDSKECFMFRNSWGEGWGLDGNAWIPYTYLTNPRVCDDLWTLRDVTG
jgi:C1A family cysteine protease